MTPEVKFGGVNLHSESTWTYMTHEAKFKESETHFESMGT
jgi:hypothetical protein